MLRHLERIGIAAIMCCLASAAVAEDRPKTTAVKPAENRPAGKLAPAEHDQTAKVVTAEVHTDALAIGKHDAKSNNVSRIYPVRDFIVGPTGVSEGSGDALIEVITSTVDPSGWAELGTGGTGTIRGLDNVAALVITQSPESHEAIAELLASLRKVREQQGLKVDLQSPPAETKDTLAKRAFRDRSRMLMPGGSSDTAPAYYVPQPVPIASPGP